MISISPLPESDRERLVRAIFLDYDSLKSLTEIENRFPKRSLADQAAVTRVAPSPTGFAHIGLIYAAIFNRCLAKQTGGVFILRVEDTDTKREVEGAFELLTDALQSFDQAPDEGYVREADGSIKEVGKYGPYKQSERKDIYRAAAAHLVRQGLAYPCFCSEEELKEMATDAMAKKMRPGYYGPYARWRDRSVDEVETELKKGGPFVVRFRAAAAPREKISWKDGVKSNVSMPANDLDSVILKSDGQTLYHLAHLVDDHFMRITDVIRGDEWVSSVPLHLQLYTAFGWEAPRFTHLSTVQKLEEIKEIDEETGKEVVRTSKRKLSKRKDPEASVSFYHESGYPKEAVVEYLLNLLNSNFEDWRRANPSLPWASFVVSTEKLSTAGALADPVKLADISKDLVSRWSAKDILESALRWTSVHDKEFFALLSENKAYSEHVLNIERGGAKPIKRIAVWSDVKAHYGFMFDEIFSETKEFAFPERYSADLVKKVLAGYLEKYDPSLPKDAWFNQCKDVAEAMGFAREVKQFKQEPDKFPGHVGDVTMLLRIAISGSKETPDLYECMAVLGVERTRARIAAQL